jgi:hypothetical protein
MNKNTIEQKAGFQVTQETINGRLAFWPTTRKVTRKAEQIKMLQIIASIIGGTLRHDSYVTA